MITSFNPEVGDCLIVVLKDHQQKEISHETKGNITRTYTEDGTVGFNFFEVVGKLNLEGKGQIFLNEDQVNLLNEDLKKVGFEERLVMDNTPKIVVGEVLTKEAHPDSDHLSITETKVAEGKTYQIVCGAPNVEAGQKVVVALPGAMMPDGTMIWPGKLRGVESYGMLCSARELAIPNAPQVKGILVLDENAPVGVDFKEVVK